MRFADRSSLFLFDHETSELFSRVMQGDVIGEIRFPSHLGVAGSVFTSGQAEIIPDAYLDARFNQEFDRRTGYRTRSIICMAAAAAVPVSSASPRSTAGRTTATSTRLAACCGR